jgi:hypothetical protein
MYQLMYPYPLNFLCRSKPIEVQWRELVAWFAQQVLLGHSQDRLELSFIELAPRFDGLDFQTRSIKGSVIVFAG